MPDDSVIDRFEYHQPLTFSRSSYELKRETLGVKMRRGVRYWEAEMPLEALPRDPATISTFRMGFLLLVILPLLIAAGVLFAPTGPGTTTRTDRMPVVVVLSLFAIPGAIACYVSSGTYKAIPALPQPILLPYAANGRAAVDRFLERCHETKLGLINRRIHTVKTLPQVEDMYRRLSNLADRRVISQSELEDFTQILDDIRIQVS